MDINTVVIVSGLVATLVALAAVQDAWNGWEGTVGPMRWNFAESWTTSAAAIVAVLVIFLFDGDREAVGLSVLFGVLLLFGPVIYRALEDGDAVPKVAFFAVAALMAWAILGLLYTGARFVPEVAGEFSLLPRIVLNGVAIAAVVGGIVTVSRALSVAATSNGQDPWTLP